jgi:hypothetical protein
MKSSLIFILSILNGPIFGQHLDLFFIKEKINSAKVVEIYQGRQTRLQKGFWTKIKLDTNGYASESFSFKHKKLMDRRKYVFNEEGRLNYEIVLYDINNSSTGDTIKYTYIQDSIGHIVWEYYETKHYLSCCQYYGDFNEKGLPLSYTLTSAGGSGGIFSRKIVYDQFDNEILVQQIVNNELVPLVEKQYNKNRDVTFIRSYHPIATYPPENLTDLKISPFDITEYDYEYDILNRMTTRFEIIDGKKIVLEKRVYK